TGGVRCISPTKRLRRDSLTIPMAVEALISSSPLSHGSPRQVAQVTPFPEGRWRPGALRRWLDNDNAFGASWGWRCDRLAVALRVGGGGFWGAVRVGQAATWAASSRTIGCSGSIDPASPSCIAREGARHGSRSGGSVASCWFARAWTLLATSVRDT